MALTDEELRRHARFGFSFGLGSSPRTLREHLEQVPPTQEEAQATLDKFRASWKNLAVTRRITTIRPDATVQDVDLAQPLGPRRPED